MCRNEDEIQELPKRVLDSKSDLLKLAMARDSIRSETNRNEQWRPGPSGHSGKSYDEKYTRKMQWQDFISLTQWCTIKFFSQLSHSFPPPTSLLKENLQHSHWGHKDLYIQGYSKLASSLQSKIGESLGLADGHSIRYNSFKCNRPEILI